MLKWLRKLFKSKGKHEKKTPYEECNPPKPEWLDRMIDESEAEMFKRYGNGKE